MCALNMLLHFIIIGFFKAYFFKRSEKKKNEGVLNYTFNLKACLLVIFKIFYLLFF